MSDHTSIQWADGTVSPVPSCGGCPLRKSEAAVKREIEKNLRSEGLDPEGITLAVPAYQASSESSRRKRIFAAVSAAVAPGTKGRDKVVLRITRRIYKTTSSCYAGVLTDNRGGKVKGYAERFDTITPFAGRMEKAARKAAGPRTASR